MSKIVIFDKSKKKTKHKGIEHYRSKFRSDSKMQVAVNKKNELRIVLSGPIAQMPSYKNAKQVGAHGGLFFRANVKAHIQVMDDLWKDSGCPYSLGAEPSYVWTIFATPNRGAGPDEDGVTAYVKDWLEHPEKSVGTRTKKARGWGAGIIDKDDNCLGRSTPWKMYYPCKETHIMVFPYANVRPKETKLISELMLSFGTPELFFDDLQRDK